MVQARQWWDHGSSASAAGSDASALLSAAIARHRAGDANVDALYCRILALYPSQSDALHLHGLVALQKGLTDQALVWIRRALRINTAQAMYRNSLGEAYRASNQQDMASQEYRRALALNPSYWEALANLLKQAPPSPRLSAQPPLQTWLWRLRVPTVSDLITMADARLLNNKLGEARLAYRAAIAIDPASVQAYVNIGAVASRSKVYPDAAVAYRRALTLSREHAGAWNNLASVVWEMNDGPAATRLCRRSIVLKPDHPDPYANLGYVVRSQAQDQADFASAEAQCLRALRIAPSHVSATNNLGIIHLDLGNLVQAETLFRRTLAAEPKHPDARFNLSLALLKAGQLKEAWEHYEARWETGQLPAVAPIGRPWQGEPLQGATIVLHAEQGHGDTLHFVRYAPLVADRGGRVVLVVQPALKRLVAQMPKVATVHGLNEQFPAPDFLCSLMSLPRVFGTELDSIPSAVPYLFPPVTSIGKWLGKPLPGAGLRVGLVWSGDPRPGLLRANLTDRRRSMTLRDFEPLARIPNVTLVNLQMGAPATQLDAPPAGMRLWNGMGEVEDFADTAALILRLDLVITVDTSVAHLAGALGKPVWVLSRYDGCWRWLQNRTDTPWYPTMRLFQQTESGNWGAVVERVAQELSMLAA
ncbi:tetratricopeptide repeat protein [Azospirillum picis]|uniref:Tetratricopeptide (TPR) repeat protein n=1 Tax=Azospirillum picis TaxID=488438 RepID=A0ABU0MTF5_9PROT|nr:tetratricopeptide repeat protein [Azospirillum picis]MBP2302753.1 tetratricopeptide (TPR) repeat protein [Azospirillum picis]MDQ0536504.1 tetratricopeptide (TPR) repeat protein [Azospirillum picis]